MIVGVGLTKGTIHLLLQQHLANTALAARGLSTEVTFTSVVIGLDGVFLLSKQIVSITRIPSFGTMHRRIVLNTNSNSSIGAGPDRRRKSLSEEVALMLNQRGY